MRLIRFFTHCGEPIFNFQEIPIKQKTLREDARECAKAHSLFVNRMAAPYKNLW